MSITFDGGIRTSHLKCQKLNFKQKLLVLPQVTWKFPGSHLDWQYLGPRHPYLGNRRLFNLQGYHSFETAMYPRACTLRFSLQKIQITHKLVRNTSGAPVPLSLDFCPISFQMIQDNCESREVRRTPPFPSYACLIVIFLSPHFIITFSAGSEFFSGLNKVLPEEFQDLSPGVLLGCCVSSRVPSPEQGPRRALGWGRVTQGCIGRLYEMARPGVRQHPSVVSPMAPQLAQGLLSILLAIEAFVILSNNEKDWTLGLFNRKHALLIQFIPGVPLVVAEAHSPRDVKLHALYKRGDGRYNQIFVPERKFVDGIGPIDADGGCHLLQEAGHGQPDLCTFAHRDHSDSWHLDLKRKIKGTHHKPYSKELPHRPVS